MTMLTIRPRRIPKPSRIYRPLFSSFSDDFNNNDENAWNKGYKANPKVNILEGEDHFEIALAVPGYNKQDFEIALDNDQLIIKVELQDEKEEENEKYNYRQFGTAAFSKSFTIPETVDVEKVEARYEDGILQINLPKVAIPEKESPKKIEII